MRDGRAMWVRSPNAKLIGEAGAKRVQELREAVEKAGVRVHVEASCTREGANGVPQSTWS